MNKLTLNDVQEVLKKDILIGSDSESKKCFVFNAFHREFTVYSDDKYISAGQDMEALLEDYNNIGTNRVPLTPNHIKDVLDSDVFIASDHDAVHQKKLVYNPQKDTLKIYENGELFTSITRGHAAEDEVLALIHQYNSLPLKS